MINDQKEEQIEQRENARTPDPDPIDSDDQTARYDQWEKNWENYRKPLKLKYPDLTDDDLRYQRGEFGQMLGRIGAKTGLSESQLQRQFLEWDNR
ncbi:hypothetical protein KUV50_16705 [Membranicola marinus]|uniref:Uncharacterized protein n=1 Tax=Membranihabitans marinus TaxID=1227546 RepID=A0A953HQA3_9BACT|nr:hypothetical protein [Membranihabitans marinus]MBY5959797.1 hypothetical protein [Membranihabitans marinus]